MEGNTWRAEFLLAEKRGRESDVVPTVHDALALLERGLNGQAGISRDVLAQQNNCAWEQPEDLHPRHKVSMMESESPLHGWVEESAMKQRNTA